MTSGTMYKCNVTLRYVTCRYLSLRYVTKRYVTGTAWGSFHDTCKRGHYRRYPRMQHGWRDEVGIFACDNIVSYLIPAKFHTGPTLLLHSCTLSSSVEPARKFVICEYHHASCPCVNIVYLQSRGFALALLSEFKMLTRTFFTEII